MSWITTAIHRFRRLAETIVMLGVVLYIAGRQSETYIARHIELLYPHRTVVCALTPNDAPAWQPSASMFALYHSQHKSVELIRRTVASVSAELLVRIDHARFAHWIARNRIGVVLCEYLQVAVSVGDVCRRIGVPVVAHAHGYDITAQARMPGWTERYRQHLPLVDDIVVVSRHMKEQLKEFGVGDSRIHIVPCGTSFVSAGERSVNTTPPFKVLAVGRLIAKKGPIFVLEAFRQVLQAGIPARLVVVGDGPFAEPMRQYVKAAGLLDVVTFAGELPHDEVRRHLHTADLFLQHSVTADDGDEEGLPVSILEAMSEGLPVIATDHAGIPEAVEDGVTGYLVAPGDVASMAKRAAQLLLDAPRRQQIGAAARQTVMNRFTLGAELRTLRAILERRHPHLITPA